ncbi:hypothetical protein O6H91_12G061900 [Diphasiastrum complanatum]|uniref:Uncharacterized protein n=1 Tax=Diphasiastrum complanatum TaxID=34168 RepID=A0ACC2C2T8_DIPCM|nr:hypothetical protein O6H91_12G061900 [Diphasiastrum complanatum]
MWFEIFQREKSRQKLSSPLKSANAIPQAQQEKSRQTLYSSLKRASANADDPNPEKLSECNAKKKAKSPLRSKSHSALEPKLPVSVKLASTVGSSCNNNLGKQASTMDDPKNSDTLVEGSRSLCKEGIETLVGEQLASKMETNPLVAAKVAKAAAEASAAVEGQSSTLPVLPEIVPFHKFARREKFSVKVATVDWKSRRRPDVRSPCFSSLSSGKALTALHVGLQKVNEWSLDLTGTCGNFDSLDTGGFDFYEDHVSPTDTHNALRMEDIDDEQRRLQSEDAKAEHVTDAKAENSFKDLTNDLSLLRDKCSLRDSLDEECEDRSVCGPENTVDRRNLVLEFPVFQAQPVVDTAKLMPDKIEAVSKAHKDSEKLLDLKPSRTSEENISLEKIKRAVSDYVANLLTPLYKTRKIQKDDYKLIVKKTVAKVMERDAPQGIIPDITDFLNSKRKTKIRALVDRYIEMQMSPPQSRDGLSSAPS